MRLVDADAENERLLDFITQNGSGIQYAIGHKDLTMLEDIFFDYFNSQPTAYDVDKVVEQLESQKNQYLRRAEEIKNKFGENYESQKNYGKACSYDHAIEILKSGGVE